MQPLHTHANVKGVNGREILKVLPLVEAKDSSFDPRKCLIWMDPREFSDPYCDGIPWKGVIATTPPAGHLPDGIKIISEIRDPAVIAPGDVIRVAEGSSRVSVLFRRGSNSNTLLATEQCNSFCLMCSQPPRRIDDRWLVKEILETIPLVDEDEQELGISGGEPTLLGDDLVAVIYQAKRYLPRTGLHILSNGRRFRDETYAQAVCAVRHPNVVWGVPVYSDCPEIHDYIVQSKGAWDETLVGLYNLARHEAPVEIRVVVQQANIKRLGELAHFIFRNLTFAAHVAFMGLEPIGFARRNFDRLWTDPADDIDELQDAVFFLANRGMAVSLYNFPHCTLPRELWPFAQQSISDWKNVFLPECSKCTAQDRCCGFFRTVGREWVSRSFGPIEEATDLSKKQTLEAAL